MSLDVNTDRERERKKERNLEEVPIIDSSMVCVRDPLDESWWALCSSRSREQGAVDFFLIFFAGAAQCK